MTVDEIFSSESEHLYFRLIAARNALNAASDTDTVQVLNEILDETLNNISRVGTDEEIAAAEEIVVRKSNKTVKEYLSCRQFALIANIVMFATALIAVIALVMIIIASDSKVKPIISVVLAAGCIIGIAFFVSTYMRKKMENARANLKGRTVIGCKIDTGSGPKIKEKTQQEKVASKKKTGAKVVRNYGAIIKVTLILAVLVTAGLLIYNNWAKITETAQIVMFKVGLNDPAGEYSKTKWEEINSKLYNVKKSIFYNEARNLYDNKEYKAASELLQKECYNYLDAEELSVKAMNYENYFLAKEAVSTSMKQALVYIKQIKGEFDDPDKLVDGFVDPSTLRKEYEYLIGTLKKKFKNGNESFVIQDFYKEGQILYLVEERLGSKIMSPANISEEDGIDNPDQYKYRVAEGAGENRIYWYIADDHILKVSGDVRLRFE